MFGWWRSLFGYSDVLVVGSAHLDTVVDTPELIHDRRDSSGVVTEPYVSYGAGEIRKSVGGSAYNIAVNIARPPDGRWSKNSAYLFTFLPNKVDLADLIVRKLRVAGVGTRYVNRIRVVALAGGQQQIPHLGNFVAMRFVQPDGKSTGIAVARSSSIFRFSDLLDEGGSRQLKKAVKKSRVLVIDSDTHSDFASEALNAAQEEERPLFVSIMSIDALETYLSSLTTDTKNRENTPDAICVGVRASALENWFAAQLASKKPLLTKEQIKTLQRYCKTNQEGDDSTSPEDLNIACKAICSALNSDNVLICAGLQFTIITDAGLVRSVIVTPQSTKNWMGASDAALSAVVDTFTRRLKRGSIDVKSGSSALVGTPDKDLEIKKAITSFVLNVVSSTGSTRNSSIDSTEIEHPWLERFYKFREQVVKNIMFYVLGLLSAFAKTVIAAVSFEWHVVLAFFTKLFGR
jgi:hypothetical protein